MKKKILIVGQHFWPESFRINDIAEFLANEKGHDVDVLCGIPNYPSGKFTKGYSYFKNRHQKHHNISINRVFEIPRGNNSNFRIFLNYITFPIASVFHVPRLLTKKYDKIFIYQLSPVMMAMAGILLGKITKTETIMYVLDLWPENLYSVLNIKSPSMRKIAEKNSHWYYKNVDKLIVLSESMRDKLIKVSGLNEDKIIVLPQAAEKLYEQKITDIKLKKRFNNTFNLVFTGNISPAQDFPTMLRAAKTLKDKGLNNIHWIIVGDGMSKKAVIEEVNNQKLNDVFTFEGQKPITDIPKYTGIADGLIGCLAKSDLLEATIPAKVMSYIASAKPIILSMDGEVNDLINNKIKGGFAGPAGDSEQLAINIEKLYNLTLVEKKSISNNLKKYHTKNFERNLILNKINDFILG